MAKTYADIANLPVYYLGESAAGQFMFGNGSPVADTVMNSLADAVKRFGSRIDTGVPSMRYSGAWIEGKAHATVSKPYTPTAWKLQPISRTEYGLGYLAGLLAAPAPKIAAATPVMPAAPVLVAPPEIMELGEDEPVAVDKPKKKRGRPRSNK